MALLRDELATARKAEEKSGTRFAKMRAARNNAEKSADLMSQALADRLRIDGTVKGRKHSLLARRQGAPTDEEERELELIRSSPLFDAAWYLRHYHDVVRSGDEPTLHFLRHPTRPIRAPGPGLRHRPLPRRPPRAAGRRHAPADPLPPHRRGPARRAVPAPT